MAHKGIKNEQDFSGIGLGIPTPITGTDILFKEGTIWYIKHPDGSVNTPKRGVLTNINSMVIVDGEDGDFITALNGDNLTLVRDKVAIGKPDLISTDDTILWMSESDYKKINVLPFCPQAITLNIANRVGIKTGSRFSLTNKPIIQDIPATIGSVSTTPFKLGRVSSIDERDNNYLIKTKLAPKLAPLMAPTVRYWKNDEWNGNQLNTPQCVGFAWAHFITGSPITHVGIQPVVAPLDIYNGAQLNDEWAGQSYDGTSVRGGAKWLKLQNKISSYLWAFDINTIVNTVLNIGPVTVGTYWYYNMFFPNSTGLIRVSGAVVGGHAYIIDGVDTKKKLFRIKNSWGTSWGKGGMAFISFTDFNKLLKQRGEACLAIENNF